MSRAAAAAVAITLLSAGCGKKGPPLPPLVRLPAAPAEVSAARRGNEVAVEFVVPAANADGSRPANISRVDVYAVTAAANIPDDQLMRLGSRIGSVDVKSPRDPNRTIEPDESASDIEPLEGDGLDQGARARVAEQLTGATLTPVEWPSAADAARLRLPAGAGAAVAVAAPAPSRNYLAVSIDTRGRPGPISRRVSVPVLPAPPAPSAATVRYDESAITVEWTPPADATATTTYSVYEVATETPSLETRLTPKPIAETKYSDARLVWGARRCYAVRSVATAGGLSVESEEPPATCVTLADTFPPAAPKGLSGVASEGSINLIWEANGEKDLAGYLVLRGTAGGPLAPIAPSPIQATIFNNAVPAGVRYIYAIVAVDTAGNRSAESNRFEEAGRN